MKDHKNACELADKALQEALDKIDELEEEDFRDAKSIIELLKENLTLWKEEEEDDNAIDDLWTCKYFSAFVRRWKPLCISSKFLNFYSQTRNLHYFRPLHTPFELTLMGFWGFGVLGFFMVFG